MNLTNEGLDEIEEFADKHHNATILLLVQTLREIRELKALQEKHKNTTDCSCDRTDSTNYSNNQHG